MSPDPKVTELLYTSEDGGIFQLTVRRRPEDFGSPMVKREKPNPSDMPPDIAQAIRVWLAGNQS